MNGSCKTVLLSKQPLPESSFTVHGRMAALFLTAKENLGGQKKPGFYKLLEFKQIGIIYAFHGITSYTY